MRNVRKMWHQDKMQQAIIDVLSGKMSYHYASTYYNVPKTTLFRKCGVAKRNMRIP